MFKARNKPFVLVFWSRDPDGSQHNTGDSLNTVTPGINGPTSLAGIKNADNNLAQLRKALDDLGLAATTNIMIAADHGFSTISKESKTSPSAKVSLRRHAEGFPADGLSRDRSGEGARPAAVRSQRQECAGRRQRAPQGRQRRARQRSRKARSGGRHQWRIGPDLSAEQGQKLARRTIKALLEQDYVSGLFVDDKLGRFPGTLPMSQLGLKGKAVTPTPSIVVNFRSYVAGCDEPTNCSVEVADTVLRQGQGMHGSFGRGDTMNFMAAIGPDFKAGYVDPLPVSNADVGSHRRKAAGPDARSPRAI